MRIVYALLCLLGTFWPLSRLWPWVAEHGVDLPLLARRAFATPIAGFAWTDVLVSGVAVIALMAVEGRRLGMRRWWLPLLGLSVGVSLALPWFLWLREHHLATRPQPAKR